jgi:hypothetical protein
MYIYMLFLNLIIIIIIGTIPTAVETKAVPFLPLIQGLYRRPINTDAEYRGDEGRAPFTVKNTYFSVDIYIWLW